MANSEWNIQSSDDENQSVHSDEETSTTPSNKNDMRVLKYSWEDILTAEEVSFFFG